MKAHITGENEYYEIIPDKMRICAAGFLFSAGRPEKQPAVDSCGNLRPRGPHPVTCSAFFCEIAVTSQYSRDQYPVTDWHASAIAGKPKCGCTAWKKTL